MIAAIGPLLGETSLDHPSAAADRRCIDLWCMDGWPLEVWRWNATEQARKLARAEEFRSAWRPLVVALERLGERYVDLSDDEVTESIEGAVELMDTLSVDAGPSEA